MLLYACKTCGRWQDVSFIQAFSELSASIAKAFNQPTSEHLGYPCPAGCGLMELVSSDARIFVRPNELIDRGPRATGKCWVCGKQSDDLVWFVSQETYIVHQECLSRADQKCREMERE